jgi:hypothetical protein
VTQLLARAKPDQNRAVVDPWTVVHLATGLASGLMALPFGWCVAAAACYEVFEQRAERQRWGRRLFESRGPESPWNAVADVVAFAAGHWLGKRWNATEPRRRRARPAAGHGGRERSAPARAAAAVGERRSS